METDEIIKILFKPETAEKHLKFYETMSYKDLPKIPWKKRLCHSR